MKVVAMFVCGAGLTGIFNSLGLSGPMVLVIILALAAAGGVWALFRWFLKWREKGKSLPFVSKLMRTAGGTPQGVAADPAKRARLDDLRKKFEEGVEKFRAAGKNVYGLPWYLLVGPSGAGKTEAIRHCNVGFPPGLQDYLQGAGGTLNMHWWFTNHAVILDTAGKMFMEEVAAGESSEWKEFLKLLRESRPMQPINGMLLCIGVDSLIKDSADEIQEKAGKIARQLDLIQRTLDVRFPVYVLVTKCDLITGFREFFERVTDPQLQHQIVGWTNPAPLDEAFQPEKVDQHVESVRQRLIRRRFAHLIDPVHTDDPQARRTDQVDSLFALPDSLARLSSRLRRYLELIFVAGEWSPKPLFLRGIYFTSSMRQGAELDEEVAKILGMPVDALPGGGMTEEKSYFLRDVFTSKVFKERGLVTRATNVTKQQRARKLGLVGAGIAAVLLLGVFTVLSFLNFRESIDKSKDAWAGVARGHAALSILDRDRAGHAIFNQEKPVSIGGDDLGAAEVVVRTRELAEKPPSVPLVLKPLSWIRNIAGNSLQDQVRLAHESVLFDAVVKQVVDAARERLNSPQAANPWESEDPFAERAATGVLAGLLAIERGEAPPPPRSDAKSSSGNPANQPLKVAYPIDMDKFCGFLLPAEWRDENQQKGGPVHVASKDVQRVLLGTFEGAGGDGAWATWPPTEARLDLGSDTRAVELGVKWFTDYWSGDGPILRNLGTLGVLRTQLEKFTTAEEALATLARAYEQRAPSHYDDFAAFRRDWEVQFAELESAWRALEVPVKSVRNVKELEAKIEETRQYIKQDAEDSFRAVLGEPPVDPMATALEGIGEKFAAGKGADAKSLAAAKAFMSEWPAKVEPLRKQLLAKRDEVITKDQIGTRLAKLREFFSTGEGGKLLARSGGDTAKPACQIRFEAYQLAGQALALGEEALKGGAAPKIGGLAATGEKLEAEINSKESEVAGLSAGLADAPRLKIDKATGFGAVFKTARKHVRYRVIESGLAGEAPAGGDAWPRAKVRDLAGRLESDPISKKIRDGTGVPMLASTATTIDADFNPDAARAFFRDIRYLLASYPRTGPVTEALDSDYLVPARSAYQSAAVYAERYVSYWTTDLVDTRLAIEGSKRWSEFQRGLSELNAREDDAATRLTALGEGAGEALRVPGLAESLGDAKDAGAREKWAGKLAETEPGAGGNLHKYLQPWRGLPDDAIRAMNALGNVPKDELESKYFQGLACATPQTPVSPFSRYVDALRLRALDTIAVEVEGGRSANAPRPQAPLKLEPDPAVNWGQALSRENVQGVRDYWFAGAAGAAQGGAGLARGVSTKFDCVNAQLSRLFAPPSGAAGNAEILKALEQWIPFLLSDRAEQGGLQFRIQALPADAVARMFSPIQVSGSTSAHYVSNCTEVALGDRVERANENGDDNKVICDWTPLTLKGDAHLRFTFRQVCDPPGAVDGTRELKGPWAVLELLAEHESRALDASTGDDGPSKAWAVPVKFKGSDGQTRHKWVRIEFNAQVPSKRNWPDARAWGER